MKIKSSLYLLISLHLLFSCNSSNLDDENSIDGIDGGNRPNILLIIADDMGLDATPNYPQGIIKPNMPNLQMLMNSGITFDNLWSYPVCSPTRASILTGKYGSKTNVLEAGDVISTAETSLQNYIDEGTSNDYATAIIGKWHLTNSGLDPAIMGIDYFAGLIRGGVQSYTDWNLNINGQTTNSTVYTTTKFTDLAIDWVNHQTKPWFLWLAYNAPHTPFHLAPVNLHTQGVLSTDSASIDANPTPYFMSAIEAMDSEIGRFLDSMTIEDKEKTIIIFIGDNGSPNQVVQSPYSRTKAKNSIYQGGVNVPMVVSGFNVTRVGEREDALISTTDLFATIATMAGVNTISNENSTSFYPLLSNELENSNEFVYTEISNNGTAYAIRNAKYKLIKYNNGLEELYNLILDPYENVNIIGNILTTEESNAKLLLETEAVRIRN